MADPYHHAVSSSKKWGGVPEDYLHIHQWFDESKTITCDYRHRALRHHAEGIAMCVRLFGPVVTVSTMRKVPTRWIGEQHVTEDLGMIPSFIDWIKAMPQEAWMNRVPKMRHEITLGVKGD